MIIIKQSEHFPKSSAPPHLITKRTLKESAMNVCVIFTVLQYIDLGQYHFHERSPLQSAPHHT